MAAPQKTKFEKKITPRFETLHSHHSHSHRRQEPFLVARKTYTKPSTFVKYVIKLVGAANPIADSKFVEEYVMNNKANQIF